MNKTLLTACLVCLFAFSNAQTALPEKIAAALDSFAFIRPQEKAYVQTDRQTYTAGESIWFKTYTMLEAKPTVLSKVIYVDLLDATGSLVEKKMLKLKEGTANGVMDLRADLAAGTYYLRCYTLWMLNFPGFIPQKKISIISSNKTAGNNTQPKPSATIRLSFFPEGGYLVNGIKSVIAFKALDAQGDPVTISGDIVNSKNEKLVSFKSTHDGMGSFELQPNANETYKAFVRTGAGSSQSFVLPVAREEGIVLSVDNSGPSKIFVKATRSEKSKEKYNSLLLLAQLNYQVAYMGKFNFEEGLDAAAINKKSLPPGIMQITVLAEDGKPLAERLVFISNHTNGNPLLQASQADTEKRKKNSFLLDVSGFNSLQAAVAVTNARSEQAPYAPTIQSSLLLSSDLKGYINDPGYYFKDMEAETLQHLDLLMMIHGWRRYNLEEIMANQFPPLHYPFETGLSITGKVLQSNGRSVLKDGKINMMIRGEDSTQLMTEAKTNASSVFVVNDIDFRKSAMVYYQGSNADKQDALVTVKIDSAYIDTLSKATLNATAPGLNTGSAYLEQLLAGKLESDSAKGKTIREVVLRAKKRSVTDSLNLLYASDLFFNSDQNLTPNPNITYYDIFQFLRMNVPGIAINKTDTGTQVNFTRYEGLDMFSENTDNSSVQFFLNEVPVNISLIESIDPADVGLIKVYKGVTGIALGATRGAIAIYTNKGSSGRHWRDKGFDHFRKSGYAVYREFYEMDYSKVKPDNPAKDIRTTLYWNPDLKIKDGKALIEFYNDDVCKKFKVVVEGMDKNGKLLHAEKEIE